MRIPMSREQRRRFWSLIRSGRLRGEAAIGSGLSETSGKRLFNQAGGVFPAHVLAPPGGRYLSFAEREEIFAGVTREDSIRAIAKHIGRSPSTVLRELRRNTKPHDQAYRTRSLLKGKRGRPRSRPNPYRPSLAQMRADAAAARPKIAKLASNRRLREVVQDKLTRKLSPEQISAQLRREFPDDVGMRASPETIYQSIYVQGRGALRRELAVCLRTGRALRKPRRNGQERRGRIQGMVNISERPAEVEDRAIPGHWEGDLIIGKNGKSAIGTLVERTSRYVILLHLPNGQSAEAVEQAMIAAAQRLPDTLWKTLTWDQGWEMRNHVNISVATGLDIYFCDPAKPWQRGSNENTNGLLRQYFPKGTDLSQHTPEYLEFVSVEMNQRPRKTLGWLTPADVLAQILSASSPAAGVASIN